MKSHKLGAIDIGSNAVRLLISTVVTRNGRKPVFKKTSLIRVPIRLGQDVFMDGDISDANATRLQDTMQAYRLLIDTHQVEKYRACATSAMREAVNGKSLVGKIKKENGIDIEIIGGKEEASIIAATSLGELINKRKNFLYMDVGGGSTEFTVFSKGHTVASKSFKLGTVRMLNDLVGDSDWKKAGKWVKKVTKDLRGLALIGSGGNINNIFKQSGKKPGKPLTFAYLLTYYQVLKNYSYEDRVTILSMNLDRADVVVPALKIYLSAMKWARAQKIYVPKIGLADGIVKLLYDGLDK